MLISRVFQHLAFSTVCLAGLAFTPPAQAASAVRAPISVFQSEPSVTLARWEYRNHRRHWVQERRRYRRYDRRH